FRSQRIAPLNRAIRLPPGNCKQHATLVGGVAGQCVDELVVLFDDRLIIMQQLPSRVRYRRPYGRSHATTPSRTGVEFTSILSYLQHSAILDCRQPLTSEVRWQWFSGSLDGRVVRSWWPLSEALQ